MRRAHIARLSCLASLLLVSCTSQHAARRQDAAALRPPVTPEQRVWMAAAQSVYENESRAVRDSGSLAIYHRTSFPAFRLALSQLEKQARKGFCGLSPEAAAGLIRSLYWQNRRTRPIEDVFEDHARFAIADRRGRKANQLGLSSVVFDRAVSVAYLNVDIGGQSGSIVQLRLENGAWALRQECATWVAWR